MSGWLWAAGVLVGYALACRWLDRGAFRGPRSPIDDAVHGSGLVMRCVTLEQFLASQPLPPDTAYGTHDVCDLGDCKVEDLAAAERLLTEVQMPGD